MEIVSPRRAVIDIGSNSVRLVIFEGPARAPIAVFNEKSLCGLGDREPDSGALRETSMADALKILRRFASILADENLASLKVIATAASREAPNGPDFLSEIRRIGFEPTLLTGEEEAKLAAFGILSGAPEVMEEEGGCLAGDMGGGSLELSHLDRGAPDGVADLVSLPIGGLRLASRYEGNLRDAKKAVNAAIADVPWLKGLEPTTFYIVGGAWRALGRLAIMQTGHPISILDHFWLPAERAIELCRLVEQQSVESLASTPGVPSRRAPTLPFAAMVLRKIVSKSGAKRVAISSCGVREGSLYAELSPEERAEDPLVALSQHYAERLSPGGMERRRAIFDFLSPAFANETSRQARLRRAAAKLTNVAGLFHPDSRGNEAAVSVLNMPFISVDHPGRVALAAILFQRHTASEADFPAHLHTQLLDDDTLRWTRQVGLGLRFASDFDPVGRTVLPRARLSADQDTLRLELERGDRDYLGDSPRRRFEKFAGSLGLAPKVSSGADWL
ncbi:hypothetical protein [Parvularcula dongshanensis]|uniref:Exopolyphosphatase/guanosine-5'-triphosphate, 3'-diphosphate pyrophosphatase n=1 Tax=Parvularcula dongshanensis TaxID=1173995 RepID=A0A840I6F4_9PROT|nr:exopolyphosphatase/guanosine-5'-triphosphate,3'-diphosphate pyrophosphatase [Parvularcula dongshanensis]